MDGMLGREYIMPIFPTYGTINIHQPLVDGISYGFDEGEQRWEIVALCTNLALHPNKGSMRDDLRVMNHDNGFLRHDVVNTTVGEYVSPSLN